MGAQASKKWSELAPETPQAQNPKLSNLEDFEDPRSPLRYQRTPIHLQNYEDSPHNLELYNEAFDPRSPTVLISRTPISLSKSTEESEVVEPEVFETRTRSSSEPQSPSGPEKVEEKRQISPGAPLTRNDKLCLLKQTCSPGDFKRKRRVSRRQSVPQQLFSDSKVAPVTRSPLAQRNRSEGEDTAYNAKGKKFTFVPRKSGLIYEDFSAGKENNSSPLVI